jgi:hypothetical protein
LNEEQKIQNITIYDLTYSIPQIFPWAEYVVRAGWVPGGKYFYCQLLDRQQQRLELILYPFTPINLKKTNQDSVVTSMDCFTTENGLPTAPVYVIYAEKTDVWINVHDIISFLPCDDPNLIMFLWASEETGYRHLYLIKSELRPAMESSWPGSRHPRKCIQKVHFLEKKSWIVSLFCVFL